ncbi:DUF1127 domain-containing protein [Acidisoma cladoniae]|uniref:DUF1127 domain-containing protein n=1 Tax=Acidisoma cladoniae TaxID=3040935 RepID=UPI00254A60E1|nr:DUF1127 domain-containing protein [Acidisoma sp. PAMC 29798]
MSLTLRTSRFAVPRLPVVTLWRGVVSVLRRLRRDANLRRDLERMDDHMLSDIGVSRAQLGFEVDRQP